MMLDDSDKQWILDLLVNQLAMFEKRLDVRLERMESTLLHFIRSNELRLRGQQATIVSIEQRVDDLSDRVSKLEGNV